MTLTPYQPLRAIHARPLSPELFSPYGEVIQHSGAVRRHFIDSAYAQSDAVHEQKLWVSRVEAQAQSPLTVTALERHPHSAQTFIPLTRTPYLVIVAPALPDGMPDTDRLEAFLASPDQGVCYGRGIWHHGLSVLQAPAEFVVLMGLAGQGNDEFLALPESSQLIVHYGEQEAHHD